jgi:hypothetical protein
MPTQSYEVIIEETFTRVLLVTANNRGMAKIRAKLQAKQTALPNTSHMSIVHCEPVADKPSEEANAVS